MNRGSHSSTSAAGEDVLVGRPGAAQRPRVDLALLHHLGGAHHHPVPRCARDADPHAPDEVLAEVEHGGAARRPEHGDRRHVLRAPDRRPLRRDEGGRVALADRHRLPAGVVEPGRAPARPLQARVVELPVVVAGAHDRAGRRPPRRVGRDDVDRAVRIRQLELGDQREVTAEQVAEPAVPAHPAAVPPVTQPGPDRVVPRAKQPRDVVGVVPQPVLVGRPARRHGVVADPLPVDLDLVEPVGGRVEASVRQSLAHREVTSHQRRHAVVGVRVLRPRRPHRPGRPVLGPQQAGLDVGRRAPRGDRAVRAGDADAYRGRLPGTQRDPRPGHQDTLRGGHRLVGVRRPRAARRRPASSRRGRSSARRCEGRTPRCPALRDGARRSAARR